MAAPVTTYSPEDFFGRKILITDLDDNTLASDLESVQAFIPLDITAYREIATNAIQNLAAHGGILASDSTPILSRVNGATDRALRLTWAASDSCEIAYPPIPWPPDLDATANVVMHFILSRGGTTDDCDIDVLCYETSTGAYAADTEMGGKSAALTGAANLLTEVTVTLSASDIAGHPGMLHHSLLPDAHTTDSLFLWTGWVEYTRALRTS